MLRSERFQWGVGSGLALSFLLYTLQLVSSHVCMEAPTHAPTPHTSVFSYSPPSWSLNPRARGGPGSLPEGKNRPQKEDFSSLQAQESPVRASGMSRCSQKGEGKAPLTTVPGPLSPHPLGSRMSLNDRRKALLGWAQVQDGCTMEWMYWRSLVLFSILLESHRSQENLSGRALCPFGGELRASCKNPMPFIDSLGWVALSHVSCGSGLGLGFPVS